MSEIVLQGGRQTYAFVAPDSDGKIVLGLDKLFRMYLGPVGEERLRRFLNQRWELHTQKGNANTLAEIEAR